MLALAALSARALAEAAARDGVAAIALDPFGDLDTQRAAAEWIDVGGADPLAIDAERLLAALERLARRGDVDGWIAGSGFEGRPDLLAQGAARLPLLGSAPEEVRRVRDPRDFFAVLAALGIAHPPVRYTPPPSGEGWLRKHGGGCGGWSVRRDAHPSAEPTDPGAYWQRERAGRPMSATFVANGRDAVLLGLNEQQVQAIGTLPFVFAGVLGPVPASDALLAQVTRALRGLAAEYRLRGLASLDFLCDGDTAEVLELNPRPPASLALYPRVGAGGPLRAHLRACTQGELPDAPAADTRVRAHAVVYARRPLAIDARTAEWLVAQRQLHDQPRPGTRVAAGDPVCSLSGEGDDAAALRAAMAGRREALLMQLENRSLERLETVR